MRDIMMIHCFRHSSVIDEPDPFLNTIRQTYQKLAHWPGFLSINIHQPLLIQKDPGILVIERWSNHGVMASAYQDSDWKDTFSQMRLLVQKDILTLGPFLYQGELQTATADDPEDFLKQLRIIEQEPDAESRAQSMELFYAGLDGRVF